MAVNGGPIRIAVDCMGGDRAPGEIVAGALAAARAHGLSLLLVGIPEAVAPLLPHEPSAAGADPASRTVELVPSDRAVPEGAPPLATLRAMPNASMSVTMRLIRQGRADAAISAGSTGPTLLAAIREIGMIEGVRRACVGRQILEIHPETFLIDLGPTIDCEAHHLVEFAVMGTTYMRVFGGVAEPTVALLSNGHEPGKGNKVVKQAADLLARHHLMAGEANVVVCDGFVGNAVLKTVEGLGREAAAWLRRELDGVVPAARADEIARRLVAWTKPIDLQGSLPLLGVRGNVVMAHGASDRTAIQAAIGQAVDAVRGGFVERLRAALGDMREHLGRTTTRS